jgi:uncharacterized phage protein (TIGR01671 family)
MREIKFRVWDKRDNCWIKEFKIDESGMLTLPPILITPLPEIIVSNIFDRFEVIQFTGRKDKNEKEIYEGDIIKHQKYIGDSETEIISIESLEMFFGNLMYDELELAYDWEAETIEIIGNKFKNPELFEEEREKQ